jgi:hypothetical protein
MQNFITIVIIPVIIVIVGLIIEYWIIQPIRKKRENVGEKPVLERQLSSSANSHVSPSSAETTESQKVNKIAGNKCVTPPQIKDEINFNIDVPDALGPEVLAFASLTKFELADNDPNASDWATLKGLKEYASVEGFWNSRWCIATVDDFEGWFEGTAQIRLSGNWVLIYCEDNTNQYVIKAQLVSSKKLIGRYLNLNHRTDSTPWVGIIVDNRRIDGKWQKGRWDFRR